MIAVLAEGLSIILFTKTKQMKHVLNLGLLALFVLLFTNCQAQEVKAKQKGGKTKMKTTGNAAAISSSNSPDSAAANSNRLANTSWQTYVGNPLNDTIIIHYTVDSSDVRAKSTGEVSINTVYTLNQDTITFHDVGGENACPSEMVGRYHIVIDGDTLKYNLIEDACDGRAAVLKELTWQKLQ